MSAPAVEYKDLDSVIDGFRMHESPYFSVWQSNTLKFCCDKEEIAEAEEMLRDGLAAIEQSGTTAIYTVRVHPDAKNFNNKKNYKGSFTFRLNDGGNYTPIGSVNRNDPNFIFVPGGSRTPAPPAAENPLILILAEMQKTNQAILDKLNQEDEEEEEEEEEESDEELLERKIAMIGGIFDRYQPHITAIIDRIFPLKNNQDNNNFIPQNIGNVAQAKEPTTPEEANQRVAAAITALEQKLGAPTLVMALEKLAAMPDSKLKMALTFL